MSLELLQKDLTQEIIGAFYTVYNEFGYGFLESVYKNALSIELQIRNLKVKNEKFRSRSCTSVLVWAFTEWTCWSRTVFSLKRNPRAPFLRQTAGSYSTIYVPVANTLGSFCTSARDQFISALYGRVGSSILNLDPVFPASSALSA
jgi:hypothetical protein